MHRTNVERLRLTIYETNEQKSGPLPSQVARPPNHSAADGETSAYDSMIEAFWFDRGASRCQDWRASVGWASIARKSWRTQRLDELAVHWRELERLDD